MCIITIMFVQATGGLWAEGFVFRFSRVWGRTVQRETRAAHGIFTVFLSCGVQGLGSSNGINMLGRLGILSNEDIRRSAQTLRRGVCPCRSQAGSAYVSI